MWDKPQQGDVTGCLLGSVIGLFLTAGILGLGYSIVQAFLSLSLEWKLWFASAIVLAFVFLVYQIIRSTWED